MEVITLLFILGFLVLFSAFYAASEMAIVSLRGADVASLKRKYPRMGKRLEYHRNNTQRFVINISVANNFINIFATALATAKMVELFPTYGVLIATVGMTILILLFGEIIPKVIALSNKRQIARFSATPLWWSAVILTPIIWVFTLLVKFIAKDERQHEQVTTSTLKYYVDRGHESGAIDKQEREYIKNIIQLDTIAVKEVMTPKNKVMAISIDSTVYAANAKFKRSGYSRAPIYSGDEIVGILHVKDLLQRHGSTKIKTAVRKPFFVSEETRADDILEKFQKEDTHFAIVIGVEGEYVGIVTMEDIIEEIIGEIYDETDTKRVYMKKKGLNKYHVQGDYELIDFNKKVGLDLRGAMSIGGFIVKQLEKIPQVGDKVSIPGGTFEVLRVRNHRIRKAKFTKE